MITKPKKSLGQNFLQNKSIVGNIIRVADVNSKDVVLEIGPGCGILTEELLKFSKKVIAVEKDDVLFEELKEKFSEEIENKKLVLIHGDILEEVTHLDVPRLSGYKLVANIPYNITGEILRMFLSVIPEEKQPKTVVLLVQKEVAERIVAHDGKESILSISVRAYGNPKLIKKVKKENFSPQPKVDSAILRIENISKDFFKGIDEKKFFEVVKMGFSQKRKKLSNTLKPIFGENLEKIFQKAQISPDLRAEKLSLDDWKRLLSVK
jgi:16S rRNA (adenine1518-N6/adenine1519-N6)-dimethyltransferase